MTENGTTTNGDDGSGGSGQPDVDVVVVGAGFAGLYLLHRLREAGFSSRVFESAADIGGTWYWNRYPGARCDIPTTDYTYSFDPDLEHEWQWSEKYATQPEILRYLDFVATKYDLRSGITFDTKVAAARWDEDQALWRIETDTGEQVSCRWYVMATGCLSQPKTPEFDGLDDFAGEVYYTSRWPHEGVDFTGKRVAVIGTGSSGIQSIPLIAEQAEALTVFQRTPNFSIPAHNGPPIAETLEQIAADRDGYREAARWSRGGVPTEVTEDLAMSVSEEERRRRYESVWEQGTLMAVLGSFADLAINPEANETFADFIRGKIRSIVDDPETAETLCPYDHPFGTKRPCLDTNYYATYNRPNVELVDLRKTPFTTMTEAGVATSGGTHEVDAVVFATGFDAMTGAIVGVDITGRDGASLKDKWADGPLTYLGLTINGFPNFFAVTGPGSPSVLSNMAVSIEQHVDWVADCIEHLRSEDLAVIEATELAEQGWVQHVNDGADITLYPRADSWYMGANVPGKPRVFLPYIGGVDNYRRICGEVVEQDYLGFTLASADGDRSQTNDGVIRRLQPDVQMILEMFAEMGVPAIESLSVAEARGFFEQSAAQRPPGPEVGEIVDGTYPAADGELPYRLYRPATDGPHPVVVYYHGGGWVLGSADSDDPLCRDLCVRSDAIIVSVDYRHAPEHPFPAAPDDAFAALQWVAANAEQLGGRPGGVAVCGWSAGGNLATVAAQQAAASGGPNVVGQVLLNPVTDADFSRQSYTDNAEGYFLTTALMHWFWDYYADEEARLDPRASPIRAADLSGQPPAVVVAAEFDPLRDGDLDYVEALQAAGSDARVIFARGHTHTSVGSVDMVISGAPIREEMAAALRSFFGVTVGA